MSGRGHGHDVLGMVLLMVRMVDGALLLLLLAVHKLPYFGIVVVADVVRQVRLLEPGGGHALVARVGARAGRTRVRRVQARLYQRLARLRRDHRLQLARGERVHVTRLGRHQQHHLRARQRRQLVRLLHADTKHEITFVSVVATVVRGSPKTGTRFYHIETMHSS